MFTKTASDFLKSVKTEALNDVRSPLALGAGAYMYGSGAMSLGGAAGMTAGMSAANSLYNNASKKYILPKLEGLASKLPGRLGGAAKSLIGAGNFVTGLIAPAIAGGAIGNVADKYIPIHKRKSL